MGVGDVIQKVAQGSQEPVDMAGYFTEDAIKIIRGTTGTEVRLWLKSPMDRLRSFRLSATRSCRMS